MAGFGLQQHAEVSGRNRCITVKSSKQLILARFFAPRLFEAFRKSKRYLRTPVVEDLSGREYLKLVHFPCRLSHRGPLRASMAWRCFQFEALTLPTHSIARWCRPGGAAMVLVFGDDLHRRRT